MLPGCYSLVPADPAPFHYRPGLVAWELALDHHCSRDSPSYDRPLPPFKKHQKNLIPLCLGDSFQIRPIWVFPKIMVPQNGWFIMVPTLLKWMIWGHPICGNTHISLTCSEVGNSLNPPFLRFCLFTLGLQHLHLAVNLGPFVLQGSHPYSETSTSKTTKQRGLAAVQVEVAKKKSRQKVQI